MELGCVPEANSFRWDGPQGSWGESLLAGIKMKSGAAWLERELIFCPMAARSLRVGLGFFQQRQNDSSCAASFKSMAPWQTVVHDLERTYCKTPSATPECWCPEERTRCWGKSCRTPSSAGPHQAAQPQLEWSAVASLSCWPGRAGGRDRFCSNWTGMYRSQSSSFDDQSDNFIFKHLHPAGCKRKTSLNWCMQLGQACCQNRSALLFEGPKVQGQSNYSTLLLGEAAPRQPCWVTATVPYPPDAEPASLCSRLSNPALGPFDSTA